MTKAKISEYDAVAANNTDVNGVNIDEGCAPSGMNNMGREIMAALKRFETGADGDSLTVGGNLIVSGTVTAANTATLGNVDVNGGTIDGAVIGGSTAAAGSFTTLTTSSTVTHNGGTANGVAFLNGSKVLTAGSALSFNGTVLQNTQSSAADGIMMGLQNTTTGSFIQFSQPAVANLLFGCPNADAFVWKTFGSGTYPERMRIDSSGNLLVGTTSNSRGSRLLVEGQETAYFTGYGNGYGIGLWMTPNPSATGGTATPISFQNVSDATVGSISTTASATAFNTSSDYRLKENVAPMTGALAKVLELNPVTYTWKVDGSAGQGFIAHELQAVCPDAVTGEKDAVETKQVEVSPAVPATYDEEGNELTPAVEAVYEEREVPKHQGVDTSFLVATLTAAIQELKAINDAQASRIETLEAKVAALEAR
jgi:hypothetical protein